MNLATREIKALVKVLVLVPLAVLATWMSLDRAGIVSMSTVTRASVSLLLAFLIGLPTAISLLKLQQTFSYQRIFMTSALLFVFLANVFRVVHILLLGSNFLKLGDGEQIQYLLELSIFGMYSAAAIHSKDESVADTYLHRAKIVLVLLVSLPLPLFPVAWYLFVQSGLVIIRYGILYGLGMTGIIFLLYILYNAAGFRVVRMGLDSGYFAASSVFLLLSFVLFMLEPFPQTWIFAENLIIASFFTMGYACVIPYFRRLGVDRKRSYLGTISLQLISYIPVLTIVMLESNLIRLPFIGINIFANTIIHLGSCFLAFMMGSLLLYYSTIRFKWSHYPLVLFFYLWGAASGVAALVHYIPFPAHMEVFVAPYTTASIFSTIVELIIILWTIRPPTGKNPRILKYALPTLSLLFVVIFLLGEYIQQYINVYVTSLSTANIARAILLGTNSLMLIGFIYLIFYLCAVQNATPSFEFYVISYCTIWVIPNIFMSFYAQWSSGWYISELMIFVTFITGPAILAWLYIRALRATQESQALAGLYSDILIHDITNYNQMALSSVELLRQNEVPSQKALELIETARHAIFMADRIISDVRLMNEVEQISEESIGRVNLTSLLINSLNIITKHYESVQNRICFVVTENAFINANHLVEKTFVNLFVFLLDIIDNDQQLEIHLGLVSHTEQNYWRVSLVVPGLDVWHLFADDESSPLTSKSLRFQVAKMLTKKLAGSFSMRIDLAKKLTIIEFDFPSL